MKDSEDVGSEKLSNVKGMGVNNVFQEVQEEFLT